MSVTPFAYRALDVGIRFNPWRRLRETPQLALAWELLPEGLEALYSPNGDGTATIVIDAGLTRTQRRAALCHELVHHERGITGDARVDERGVEDEVASRLVPFDELAAMYHVAVTNDLPVETWMVAEKFDVPDSVAERAMLLFLGRVA